MRIIHVIDDVQHRIYSTWIAPLRTSCANFNSFSRTALYLWCGWSKALER